MATPPEQSETTTAGSSPAVARRELLERYGAFYGGCHFAIVWTETNRADAPGKDPKRVTMSGWQHTQPLAHAAAGVALLTSRGQHRNPGVNLRTSGLVGVECDGADDAAEVAALGLPETLIEQSSLPTKLHYYFRPPRLETLTYVSFRFEGGKLTPATNNYYVAAPSLHPSGATYSHLPGPYPSEVEIAAMPADLYRELVARGEREDAEQRRRIALEPGAKIHAGNRRTALFRFACALRRWETDAAAIEAECQRWNLVHCEPPVARLLVARQVEGAMKMAGGQDLRRWGDE